MGGRKDSKIKLNLFQNKIECNNSTLINNVITFILLSTHTHTHIQSRLVLSITEHSSRITLQHVSLTSINPTSSADNWKVRRQSQNNSKINHTFIQWLAPSEIITSQHSLQHAHTESNTHQRLHSCGNILLLLLLLRFNNCWCIWVWIKLEYVIN